MSSSGKKKKKTRDAGTLEAPAPPPPSIPQSPITDDTMDAATLERLLDGFATRLGDKLADAATADSVRRDAEISKIASSFRASTSFSGAGFGSGYISNKTRWHSQTPG